MDQGWAGCTSVVEKATTCILHHYQSDPPSSEFETFSPNPFLVQFLRFSRSRKLSMTKTLLSRMSLRWAPGPLLSENSRFGHQKPIVFFIISFRIHEEKVPCLLGLLHPPFLMRRSHAHCIASYCIAVASCKMYDRQIAVVWWFKFQNLMTNDLNYMFDYAMLRMNQSAEAVPAICTEHLTLSCSLRFGCFFFYLVCLFFVLFASAPVKQYYKIVSASFWEQVRLWFRWHLRIFLHSPSSLLPLQPDGTWLRPVGNGFRAGTFPWSAAEVCRGQSYNTRENWWNWKDCCGLLWTAVDCCGLWCGSELEVNGIAKSSYWRKA